MRGSDNSNDATEDSGQTFVQNAICGLPLPSDMLKEIARYLNREGLRSMVSPTLLHKKGIDVQQALPAPSLVNNSDLSILNLS